MVKKRFGKAKYTTNVTTEKTYSLWKKLFTKYKNVKKSKFTAIKNHIFEEILDEIKINPLGVKLPSMGDISIQYIKNVIDPINFPLSKELGKDIPLLKFYGGDKTSKIVWSISEIRHLNKYCKILGFTPSRKLENFRRKALEENPDIFKTIDTLK